MAMILRFLATLAAFVVVSSATQVNPCPNNDESSIENLNVKISNCDKPPCKLPRGETITYQQNFVATKDADNLRMLVFGRLFHLSIHISGAEDKNVCDSLYNESGDKVSCPLKEGETYLYKRSYKIDKNERKASVDTDWHIKTPNETLSCFSVPIEIE